ncbi:hypothetical protein OIO90_004801, partial [Microbotryomycetes sp. JL221]
MGGKDPVPNAPVTKPPAQVPTPPSTDGVTSNATSSAPAAADNEGDARLGETNTATTLPTPGVQASSSNAQQMPLMSPDEITDKITDNKEMRDAQDSRTDEAIQEDDDMADADDVAVSDTESEPERSFKRLATSASQPILPSARTRSDSFVAPATPTPSVGPPPASPHKRV